MARRKISKSQQFAEALERGKAVRHVAITQLQSLAQRFRREIEIFQLVVGHILHHFANGDGTRRYRQTVGSAATVANYTSALQVEKTLFGRFFARNAAVELQLEALQLQKAQNVTQRYQKRLYAVGKSGKRP